MIDEKKLIKDILQHEDALKDANYVYKNGYETRGKEIIDIIERQSPVEAVPKSYVDQIRWERDVAVGQLNEIGCQFGQKMDKVKDKLNSAKNWIPCSERLPEEPGFYVVTKRQKSGEIQVALGSYRPLFNEWSGNGNFKEVIAWMPLPEPYKADMRKKGE